MSLDHFDHENMDKTRVNGYNNYDVADELTITMPLPKRSILPSGELDTLMNDGSIFFSEQKNQQQQLGQQQQHRPFDDEQQLSPSALRGFDGNDLNNIQHQLASLQHTQPAATDTFSGNYLSSMLAGGMIPKTTNDGFSPEDDVLSQNGGQGKTQQQQQQLFEQATNGGMHETFRSASTPLMGGSGVSGSTISLLSLQQQHGAILDRDHNDHNNLNSYGNFEYNNNDNNDNNKRIATDNMGQGHLINRSQSASLSDYDTKFRQTSGPSNLQIHLADIDRRMVDIRRGKPASPPLSQSQYPTGGQPTNGMMTANMMASMNGSGNGLDGNVYMQHLQQMQQQQLLMRRPASTQNTGSSSNGAMTFNAQMQQRMMGHMANSSNSAHPKLSAAHQQQGSLSQMRSASTPLPFSLHQSMDALQLHSTSGVVGKSANPLASALNLCGLEDSSVEDIVAKSCRDILVEAASHSLKAVELANTLRARVGTEVLAHIRERWGGLLSLLERHPHVFRVERIPKNDLVTLVNASAGLGGFLPTHGSMMMTGSNGERETAGLSMRGFSTSPNNVFGGQQQSGSGVFHDRRSPPIHSSTSPGLLNGGDNYSVSSMGSSLAGYNHMLGNAGALEREGAVSRCLHVGNVPSNMAESQLLRELERYGDVDCLKLVSQRSRRFAFVSFRTVEQAISAKQRMSRVHPWKSAISFAHKESQSNSFGMSPSSSPALPTQQGFMQQQQLQQSMGNMHMHMHNNRSSFGDMSAQQLQLAQYLSNTNATSNSKSPLQQHFDQMDGNDPAVAMNNQHMSAVLAMSRSQSAAPAMQTSSSFGGGASGNGSGGIYSDLQQPRPTKVMQQQQHRFGLTEDELAAMDNIDNNTNKSNNMMFAPGVSGLIRPASTGSSSNNVGSSSAADAQRARNLALHVSTADGENRDDELFLMMMQQQLAQEQNDVRQRQLMLDAKADELACQLQAMGGSNDQKTNIHQLGQQQTHGGMSAASQQSQDSEAVLRRLTDDTYVPTQPWPGNWEADAFYCSAVVAQLQQFGGTTTISKLRGFLRSRVNATDNIKSVPLKAMLSGYPAFFVVRGNAVALTPPLCQGIQSSPPMYGSSSLMSQQQSLMNNNQQSVMHGQQQQGLGGYNDYDSTSSIITGSSMGGMGTVPGYNNINNHINNNHYSAMQQQVQMQMQSTNQEEQNLCYGDFMRSAAYQLKGNQSSQSQMTEDRERAIDFSQQGDINSINKNNINNANTLLDPTLAASLLSITNLENSAGSSFSYGI